MDSKSFDTLLRGEVQEHLDLVRHTAASLVARAYSALLALETCFARSGRLLVFGNGGSAADAQHFAAELVGRFERSRRPVAAIALTTDTSALTAIANDFGYSYVFKRQVEALARPGDVVMGITTSGTSANVLEGLQAARRLGCTTVALTGEGGSALDGFVDHLLAVPSKRTCRIQEIHELLLHILAAAIETSLMA
jgi:D-sedoheptulose 7-phosphate isomerase